LWLAEYGRNVAAWQLQYESNRKPLMNNRF
jgi:hypothetical protein